MKNGIRVLSNFCLLFGFSTLRVVDVIRFSSEQIFQEGGMSGESLLWQLYHLYDFDISLDLVFDIMHIASLNLFKKYVEKLFLEMVEVSVNLEDVKNLCSIIALERPYELR
jgi:hypothetical protein